MIIILLLVARLINSLHDHACPRYSQAAICKHFERQCNTNDDCKYGDMCCPVECGTACITIHEPYDACRLQPEKGHCKGYFRRYYYDYDSKVCYRFIYGGCGGNKNNFETLEECEERCKKTEKPTCLFGCASLGPIKPTDPTEPLPPASDPGACGIDGCPQMGPPADPREHIPPPDACGNDTPLANSRCGFSGLRCPTGYYCSDFTCCQIRKCPSGDPLPGVHCGRDPGRMDCPPGYSCRIDATDRFAVCCPRISSEEKCPEVPVDYICHEYSKDCKDDSYCTDGKKCCRQGCDFVCVNPV